MAIDTLFENALASEDRVYGLRKLAQRFLEEGSRPKTILDRFEQARRGLRESGREADEDAVMDVMDFLVGWCSPHASLQDEPTMLWNELENTLQHHAERKNQTPIDTLNRLFRERFPKSSHASLPRLDRSTCSIDAKDFPLQDLLRLHGLETTEKVPTRSNGAIIVAEQEEGFYLIDGRRRINQWIREDHQGPHRVLVVAPRRPGGE